MLTEKQLKIEKEYLNKVTEQIDKKFALVSNSLENYKQRTKELSVFIADSFYDMDAQEVAVQRNLLDNLNIEKMSVENALFVCEKQAEKAYFGRIDFQNEETKDSVYIGLAFLENPDGFPYVIDWRAPISSLYYDYELGSASYKTADAEISGEITLKRQYKVEGKELKYAFDSSVTISDEILQHALGQNSGSKMKEIVSTIQKEQNELIRSNDFENLLVQGIAGSGKTSIALHRVAYLLYKNKLSSKDIVIVSPSPLFSDYIADVLPELGERNVESTTFEEIAKEELEGILKFESRTEMLENLLLGNELRAREVDYKQSFEFFESLKNYLNLVSVSFHAKKINLGDKVIEAEVIDKLYNERYKSKKPAIRIEWISDYIIDQLDARGVKAQALSNRIKKVLLGMFEINNITEIYLSFLQEIGMNTNIFCSKNVIHFEDVAPILYVKDYILGTQEQKCFKFAVIDEMQDYSPIALELIAKRYPCPKTILGDIYQSVERQLSHKYLADLKDMLGNTKLVKLAKTYRSTKQISQYCQKMIGLEGAINFERNGKQVKEYKVDGKDIESTLGKIIVGLEEYKHIAIITPTAKEAENLYYSLENLENITLLSDSTSQLPTGTIIIPATLCKGLEFDVVISVRQKPSNYLAENNEYITCTRALHELYVIEKE